MTQLIVHNKGQAVTTIVTFGDTVGRLYLVLARTDPRYRDRDGKSLTGANLPVGPCQFVGGVVESETSAQTFESLKLASPDLVYLPKEFTPQIAATALREIEEEIGLNPLQFAQPDAKLSLIETLTRDGAINAQAQDIHYLNFHLGTLDPQTILDLQSVITPHDDVIQTIVIRADAIKLDTFGNVYLFPADGFTKIKSDFAGFPEIQEWNRQYDECMQHATGDKLMALIAEKDAYNRINDKLRDMQGVDEKSLNINNAIGLFVPDLPGIKTDGHILKDFLEKQHGILLTQDKLAIRSPGKRPDHKP